MIEFKTLLGFDIMLKKSINFPNHIIQASRWESNNSFNEYGMLKEFLNFIFQKMFSYLFNIKCNDLTFGFRILPQRQIRKIKLFEKQLI